MKYIVLPFRFIAKIPVYIYKFLISPLLPHVCRFSPTCSNYFLQAVNEFGAFKGAWIGLKRIFRCRPKNKSYGYDPVPINIKGGSKWLF